MVVDGETAEYRQPRLSANGSGLGWRVAGEAATVGEGAGCRTAEGWRLGAIARVEERCVCDWPGGVCVANGWKSSKRSGDSKWTSFPAGNPARRRDLVCASAGVPVSADDEQRFPAWERFMDLGRRNEL